MNRKSKMAGVLMAVVAMFALTATAAQAQFTSEKYPATATATSTNDVFDAFGSTVSCKNNSFSGSLGGASNTLTITPSYTNCTAFGLPATVNFTNCDYLFYATPVQVDLKCANAGEAVDINVYATAAHETPICHVRVPAQNNLTGIKYENAPAGKVTLSGAVTVTAQQTRTSIFCPAGTHTAAANYTIQAGGIVVSGNNGPILVHP